MLDVTPQLGCGENHLAAEWILAVVVHEGFPLPAALMTTLTTWLDPYVGTRDLRHGLDLTPIGDGIAVGQRLAGISSGPAAALVGEGLHAVCSGIRQPRTGDFVECTDQP